MNQNVAGEFNYDTGQKFTELLKGKTILSIHTPDDGYEGNIIIKFDDNTAIRIRYDWIYDWEYEEL